MFRAKALSVTMILACAAVAHAQDRGRVRVQNNTVVADDGFPLRGATCTPVPGYGISNIQDPNIWTAWRDSYNMNTVRCIVFRNSPTYTWSAQFYGTAYMAISDLLPLIDQAVDQASKYGFYCIVDYHSEHVPDPSDFNAYWQAVAPRYANRTHVIFEIANEYGPGWDAGSYGPSDIQFQKNAYQLIRSLAPSTHIITDSFASSAGPLLSVAQQQASGAGAIDYSNASVGYHDYPLGQSDVSALKAQFPVICTEAGNAGGEMGFFEGIGSAWIILVETYLPSGFPIFWPLDPNTSDGTGPGTAGGGGGGGGGGTPPPPTSSGPLIGDPDFESQTSSAGGPLVAPWSGSGPAMIGVDDANGVGGSKCGYIYSPAGTGWSAITQTGTLSANTDYTLSVMIQTSSPFPGGTLGVQTPDGSTVLAQQAYGELDSYGQVTLTFNSGSATTLTIFAGFANPSGQAAWIHVDNWTLNTGAGGAGGGGGGAGGGGGTPTSGAGTSSAGGSGGKGSCGLTGLETVLVLGLLSLRRRRPA